MSTTAGVTTSRKHQWLVILFLVLVLFPATVMTVWTLGAVRFAYSSGDRAGFIQKFSRKGWICKTWEGELAIVNIPGSQPEIFRFTVRDDSTAKVISSRSMGMRVVLHYRQHRGVPFSCLGETQYFVDGVHYPATS